MQLDLNFVNVPPGIQSDWVQLCETFEVNAWFVQGTEALSGWNFANNGVLLTPFEDGAGFQELVQHFKLRGGGDLAVAILSSESFQLSGNAFRAGANDVIAMPPRRLDFERLLKFLKAQSSKLVHPDAILPLDMIEREAIRTALIACNGQVSKTSRKLGIGRSTLYRKLEQYDLVEKNQIPKSSVTGK